MSPRELRVLVTGAAGQDGAYLCRDLLASGHHVIAALRADRQPGTPWRWRDLGIDGDPNLRVVDLDVADAAQCERCVAVAAPDRIFHLAAISSVAAGFSEPQRVFAVNALGTLNMLEAMRRQKPSCAFVYAASSQMYTDEVVNESSVARARHPYALSKLAGHAAVGCYRDSYGLATSSAILFNHESPLRGAAFVTRKIAAAAACAGSAAATINAVALGNLDAQRDFGYAPEYVTALQAMAEQTSPADYVLASGRLCSVREFANHSFAAVGIDLEWLGSGADEIGVERVSGRRLLRVDRALWRPLDDSSQCGDAGRAARQFGFAARTDVPTLARLMVDAERQRRPGLDSP